MAQILSQNEIDALLGGLDAVTDQPEEEAASQQVDPGSVVSFDFRKNARPARVKLPGFDVIQDQFNRSLRGTLSSQLRLYVDSMAIPPEIISFQEFLRRIPVPGSLHILKMEPLRGHVLMVIDPQMVFSIVEIFLGATKLGQSRIEGREFTSIEQRLILRIVTSLLADLEKAWQNLMPVKIHYIRGEINPQFAKIVQEDDSVLISRYQLEIDEMSGSITLCLPMAILQPVRARLQKTFQGDETVDPGWRKALAWNLGLTEVTASVILGRASIKGADLIALAPGDVIPLETGVDDLLDLLVEGRPKYQVAPGVVKGQRAVRVESIVDAA